MRLDLMKVTSAKVFGAIIKDERKKAGLTQAELGKQAGINQVTLSLIESGNSATRMLTMLQLLSVLDLEINISKRTKTELTGDNW